MFDSLTPSRNLYHKKPILTAESTSVQNEAGGAATIQHCQDPSTFSILIDSLLVDPSIRGGVRCSGTTVVISGAISISVVVRAIYSQVRPIPQSFNASKTNLHWSNGNLDQQAGYDCPICCPMLKSGHVLWHGEPTYLAVCATRGDLVRGEFARSGLSTFALSSNRRDINCILARIVLAPSI
jgi:hypothetical protein